MSENEQAVEAEQVAEEQDAQEQAEQKPTETVEFWKAKAREQEKRAKGNAEAAKRLAEIEEAQKTEAEKAADRLRELEVERDQAVADSLRFRVASKFGISDDDADLFLTGSDEETLTKQAERLAAREDKRLTAGNRSPKEGSNAVGAEDERAQLARQIFG